ncbi:MAG: hypothetical protein KGI91_16445 [Burkholderiales bacterium]|nr:hypothetical protein [Burkholderiales bacterium]MDE2434582.1 hypothetical protein [Burkholderiales bacterium]
MSKVTNERKNLSRLAGEFLVASRLTQRGYMVALQWGTTIGYDILVFDKAGNSAFLEIKTSATYARRWVLQSKYATPEQDKIALNRRFICCVDMADGKAVPDVYVFPAKVVADGLHYFFSSKFPNSTSYHLSLDFKPQHKTKEEGILTVGQFINDRAYLENFAAIGIEPVTE